MEIQIKEIKNERIIITSKSKNEKNLSHISEEKKKMKKMKI